MKLNNLRKAAQSKPAAKAANKARAKPKSAIKVKAVSPDSEKDWRIQDDARTLQRAMEVKGDPKRLKAAKEYAVKEMEALKQVSKIN